MRQPTKLSGVGSTPTNRAKNSLLGSHAPRPYREEFTAIRIMKMFQRVPNVWINTLLKHKWRCNCLVSRRTGFDSWWEHHTDESARYMQTKRMRFMRNVCGCIIVAMSLTVNQSTWERYPPSTPKFTHHSTSGEVNRLSTCSEGIETPMVYHSTAAGVMTDTLS